MFPLQDRNLHVPTAMDNARAIARMDHEMRAASAFVGHWALAVSAMQSIVSTVASQDLATNLRSWAIECLRYLLCKL